MFRLIIFALILMIISISVSSESSGRQWRSEKVEPIIKTSGKNPCSPLTCRLKCDNKGFETCSAECIGNGCYCRCPNPNKNTQHNNRKYPDPLEAHAKFTPASDKESGKFKNPVGRAVEDLNPSIISLPVRGSFANFN